jgi:hypothetical protein
LTGLLAHDNSLGLNETESINDDLALHRLDGINDNGDGAGSELLEGLLGIDIDGGKPASETGVGVIPSNDSLWPVRARKNDMS